MRALAFIVTRSADISRNVNSDNRCRLQPVWGGTSRRASAGGRNAVKELIKAEHLCVQLNKSKKVLVRDVSFSISPGESLMILGQSGSGKTMTCHSIMGLLDPKRFKVTGNLYIGDYDLLLLGIKEKRKLYGGMVTMIPQNPMTAFDPSMKIGGQMKETLRLHSDLPSAALECRAKQALKNAGLDDPDRVYGSYPYALSGGMLQRVMIAMALMVDASLIVAGRTYNSS